MEGARSKTIKCLQGQQEENSSTNRDDNGDCLALVTEILINREVYQYCHSDENK